MATSEIEKLERRYAENPHGLTFAPLAEVHRKNGDVPRALELLTAGLELHPNYIPASIVLGRCHQDLGDLPAAEAAFAHVLRLDDENVIALKSLADINERLEHFSEAENWLRRLVSVDRSNDEAREQLRRLEGRKKAAEVAPEPAAAAAPTLEVIDLEAEPEPTPAAAPAEADVSRADVLPVDIAALELSRTESQNARPQPEPEVAPVPEESHASAAAAPEPEGPGTVEDEVQPVTGLISAEFEPPLEAIGGLGVETSEDVVLEVSGNTEFRVEDASEDFKVLAERLTSPPERQPAPPPEVKPDIAEEAPAARAEPVTQPPLIEEQSETVEMPAPRRSYLARETKGRSVASFFHSLLTARLPSDADRSGASDRTPLAPLEGPAADPKGDGPVSFDDFFGSEREVSTPSRQRADPGKDDLDQFQTWLQNLKR